MAEALKNMLDAVADMVPSDSMSTLFTVLMALGIVLVSIPFFIVLFTRKTSHGDGDGDLKKPRKMRRPKWTLDDPTQRKDIPMEMRGKGSIAAAVKRYADKQEDTDDTDSEEEQKALTPEQILAQHQETPREPHVGIFLGVDDPMPKVDGKKNARCAMDARDFAEAMGKLDYRTFALYDHKSYKTVQNTTTLPTRLNLAYLLRTLKDGKYDDATRKKPNLSPWENCLIYLSSRVRITTYGSQKSETLEFLMRQEMELDPVWIDMVELINKISEIPFRQLFVVLDVVHTGEDDIAFDDGEDRPNPGKPCCMSEILRRTGVMSGIVNSQRCSVVGMTRPDSMPKEIPDDFPIEPKPEKAKIRNGPFVHFLLAGLKEVEKRDPNAEVWKNLSAKGMGGMGGMGGGFGMMPTAAPVTIGDTGMCPYHCGDMTVDSIYRFLSKRVRLLLKSPLNDPAYHQGCVKMALAVQRAIRPRDTPETPVFMHECKREVIKDNVTKLIRPDPRKAVSVALYGEPGTGKSSLMLSVAWTKEVLDSFSDGVYYYQLRHSLETLEAEGKRFVADMQQSLAKNTSGFEGMLQTYDNGVHYLSKHFAGSKCLILLDDVVAKDDVDTIITSLGIKDCEKAQAAVLITTTSKEVADACSHAIEVPKLTSAESNNLLASAAGLLSHDDLPKAAPAIGEAYGNLPLFSAMIGSSMRGADDEKWDEFAKKVAAAEGDSTKLMDALFASMPKMHSSCLSKLGSVSAKTAVAIPALITFWQEQVGPLDWNKMYAVLAQLLDCGAGRLVVEEDYAFLLHPLIAEYLGKAMEDADSVIVNAYREHNGIPATLSPDDVNRWIQVGWDGYYHTHIPSHLHNVAPELASKLYTDPRWVVAQHDSCKIDKLVSDIRRYGSGEDVKLITDALVSASENLRRHSWEIVPQLICRLAGSKLDSIQLFCSGLMENSRPAKHDDKQSLWLCPKFGEAVFGDTCKTFDSEATCVGFWKEYLVSGYEDGTVRLWNISDGKMVKELHGHKAAVHGVVCTATGELATGSKTEEVGSRIRTWNIETGEGTVLGMLEKPDAAQKQQKTFGLKVSLGRTGTDIRDHDDDAYGYSNRHVTTDTVLVENEEDREDINCHTFMGWDSNLVATSLTFDCQVNEVRSQEHNGELLVGTADSRGRVMLFRLMTNEVVAAPLEESESE